MENKLYIGRRNEEIRGNSHHLAQSVDVELNRTTNDD